MSTQPAKNGSRRRRRALQARQLIIYTLLAAILAVGALYAAAVLTGRTPAPFARGFTSPSPEVVSLPNPPCPSSPEAKPVPPDQITVNVYNGTTRASLARIVQDGLVERGFKKGEVGNSQSSYKYVAEIRTGAATVDSAYTVAAQFVGAAIVLDSRTTPDVDVIVGDKYTTLASEDVADLDYEAPIVAPSNCVAAAAPTPDAESDNGDGSGDGGAATDPNAGSDPNAG